MIADMHCDTIYKIRQERQKGREVHLRDSGELCVNLKKMQQGKYLVQNFAIYIDLKEHEDPYENAMELVTLFEQEMEQNKELIRPVTSYAEILENQKAGVLSAMLTLEEGGMCMGEIERLHEFYTHGARMMALSWNYENELCYSAAMADGASGFGLKKRGFEFLEEMEAIGMIPDVSHLSDEGFWDLLKVCKKPFAASHSNARSVCGHRRNLTDEMLHQLGEHGGVAGLNFYPEFLGEDLEREACLDALAKHACHMMQKGGAACVGLGSDFDGFTGDGRPADASDIDDLVWALHRAGMTEEETEGILYRNVMNFYKEVL